MSSKPTKRGAKRQASAKAASVGKSKKKKAKTTKKESKKPMDVLDKICVACDITYVSLATNCDACGLALVHQPDPAAKPKEKKKKSSEPKEKKKKKSREATGPVECERCFRHITEEPKILYMWIPWMMCEECFEKAEKVKCPKCGVFNKWDAVICGKAGCGAEMPIGVKTKGKAVARAILKREKEKKEKTKPAPTTISINPQDLYIRVELDSDCDTSSATYLLKTPTAKNAKEAKNQGVSWVRRKYYGTAPITNAEMLKDFTQDEDFSPAKAMVRCAAKSAYRSIEVLTAAELLNAPNIDSA